ncbi:MAG TPA: MoxR family ATPase [Polyangia bacterium]|nr:MoxR family ATPase [Polyangia bacterium]
MRAAMGRIKAEIARVVIGQADVVDQVLTALFARGHCLLVGTPGLAKTLMARTLAGSLELQCKRVQFTPDLMPADITGTQVLEQEPGSPNRVFKFKPGPIFTNLLLADEINRTPPKTQAALLEAMQERQVTVGGERHRLPDPFFVLATQNPIEQEGTYPLPEAQLDRFMFQIDVGYPSADEEIQIVNQMTTAYRPQLRKVLSPERILELQEVVLRVPAAPHVVAHAVALCRASRPSEAGAPELIKKYVSWGAGPRASQYLVLAAKARAILNGRYAASIEDVRALAGPVLVHRVLPNFHAEADGLTAHKLVERLIEAVPPG